MLGPSALGHLIELVAWLATSCARGQAIIWLIIGSIISKLHYCLVNYIFVLDKRNTAWLRDTVRQTSLGKSAAGAAAVRPAAADFPRDVCLTVSRNHAVFRVGQHSHESGPNGPAAWAGPYGPSKKYGILWYVAVIYGMGTDRFVSGIVIIQVIYHRPFSKQAYAIMYAYFYTCSVNLSVNIYIYNLLYMYMYIGGR